MYAKLDWYSFSLTWHTRAARAGDTPLSIILATLNDLSPDLYAILDMEGDWTRGHGRKPYSDSYRHSVSGVTLFYHPALTHCVFEASGLGCDWLFSRGDMYRLILLTRGRTTRLDLACDIECDLDPEAFALARETKRFKASSHIREASGTTFYVGSRSSNRFARVYRYNAPHPRAKLLRVEYQLMAEDAKRTAQAILDEGIEPVVKALGEQFGWTHPVWNTGDMTSASLKAYRAERGQGKTLYWLCNTVAPVLRRLSAEGALDVDAWIEEYVRNSHDHLDYLNPDVPYAILDEGTIPF